MRLNCKSIQNAEWWRARNIAIPEYDIAEMCRKTKEKPVWIHFGAGNLFRAYIARIADSLLNAGLESRGIIAVDTSDGALMHRVYLPNDLLTLSVTLHSDGSADRAVLGSVAEIIEKTDLNRLSEIFCAPSLQMASLTITEKGYTSEGTPRLIAGLLYERFRAGAFPIALVSMDNCSQNGEKLKSAVLAAANDEPAFRDYLESRVAFPWTMIDRSPRGRTRACLNRLPSSALKAWKFKNANAARQSPHLSTPKPQNTSQSRTPFRTADRRLERAGAMMVSRETVNLCERMKVTACLNPLHTAMAVLGCTLGYTRISDEMRDSDIIHLIRQIGKEGLRFVQDPIVLNPQAFLNELIDERLPNPYIPDTPQRIACDTSQKIPIRYGATIRAWHESGEGEALTGVAIAIAGWLRYLLGLDDRLNPFEISPDPRLAELQSALAGIQIGESVPEGALNPILSDPALFPIDLSASPLGKKIARIFSEMCASVGAIRAAIQTNLKEAS